MINFRFASMYVLLRELAILVTVSKNNMQFVQSLGGYDNPLVAGDPKGAMADSIKGAADLADAAEKLLSELKCSHIDHAARRLKHWSTQINPEWAELNTRSRALRDAIDTELRDHLYYQYPKQKGQKLLSWETDWKVAIAAFPDIRVDVFSAVDCYALQHSTACVFHCMRVLEHGLGTLADNVGLIFDVQQWNTIIEQIEAKIGELKKTLPRGLEKNDRMQFLSEAAKEFFYFKDGWRNYVSHNRITYDEYRAGSALEHTRSFMNHLASQFSE